MKRQSVILGGWLDRPGGHYAAYAERSGRAVLSIRNVPEAWLMTDSQVAECLTPLTCSKEATGRKRIQVTTFRTQLLASGEAGKGWWPRVRYRLVLLHRLLELIRFAYERRDRSVLVLLAVDIPLYGLLAWIPRMLQIKVVPIIHNLGPMRRKPGSLSAYVWRLLLRSSVAHAARLGVLDNEVEAALVAVGVPEDKLTVIPDYRPATGIARPASMPPRRFLFLGGVNEAKGVDVLLEAWRLASDSLPTGASLQIAGKPSTTEYSLRLEKHVRSPALAEASIQLKLRRLSDAEYQECLTWADCVVLPYSSSVGERSSGVFLDAVAAKRGIIVSQCPTFAHYARRLPSFAPGNAEQLARVMVSLAKGELTTPASVVDKVLGHHSLGVAAQTWKRLISDLQTA